LVPDSWGGHRAATHKHGAYTCRCTCTFRSNFIASPVKHQHPSNKMVAIALQEARPRRLQPAAERDRSKCGEEWSRKPAQAGLPDCGRCRVCNDSWHGRVTLCDARKATYVSVALPGRIVMMQHVVSDMPATPICMHAGHLRQARMQVSWLKYGHSAFLSTQGFSMRSYMRNLQQWVLRTEHSAYGLGPIPVPVPTCQRNKP